MVACIAGVYLALLLAVNIPSVQHYIARSVATNLSDMLGTKVDVGSVKVDLFSSVRVDSLTVFDHHNRRMLALNRIDGSIGVWQLLGGQLRITSLKVIKGNVFVCREKSDGRLNCQFVIDSLSAQKGGGQKIDVSLQSLLVKDLRWCYQDYHSELAGVPLLFADEGGRSRISGVLRSLSLKNERDASWRVRNLSVSVDNGTGVEQFQGTLRPLIAGKGESVHNQSLVNQLDIKHLALHTNGGLHFTLRDSYIRFDDKGRTFSSRCHLACSGDVNSKRNANRSEWGRYVISANVRNDSNDVVMPLSGNIVINKAGGARLLKADFRGAKDIKKRFVVGFDADIDVDDIKRVCGVINADWPNHPLLLSTRHLKQAGRAEVNGEKVAFVGRTDVGWLKMAEDITLRNRTLNWEIGIDHLSVPDSVLPRSLRMNDADFRGELTLARHNVSDAVKIPLSLLAKEAVGAAQLKAAKVEYGDIVWQNVDAKAGNLDNNLNFHFIAGLDNDNNPRNEHGSYINLHGNVSDPFGEALLQGEADVHHLRLPQLGLHGSLIPTEVSGKMEVKADNVFDVPTDFNVAVKDFLGKLADGEQISISHLAMSGNKTGNDTHYHLDSDFGNGNIVSNIRINHLLPAIKHDLARHLPALIDGGNDNQHFLSNEYANAFCHGVLSVSDSRLLSLLVGQDISLQKPATLELNLHPNLTGSSITLSLPSLWFDGTPYKDVSLYLTDKHDSLIGAAMLTRYFGETPVRIENHLSGHADNLNVETLWKNLNNSSTRGNLLTSTRFRRNHSGRLAVHTEVLPTDFLINDTVWNISHAILDHEGENTSIKDLIVSRGDQYASLNASRHGRDNHFLRLQLNDIEIEYLLDLVGFDPVQFSGRASGVVRSADELGWGNLVGDLSVREFRFNTGYLGQMKATAQWHNDSGYLTFDAHTQATPDDSTIITGNVGISNSTLDILIRSEKTNLQFLNKYLGGFMSDLEGNVSGQFRVFGTFHDVQMAADERINYFKFRPKITGVLYTIENEPLSIRPDTIDLTGLVARDAYGNGIDIKGSLNHHFLRHFNYDFAFSPHNAMILNWPEDPSRSFWGTFFADGDARLYGNFDVVNLTGELTTAGNEGSTVVNYNSEAATTDDNDKDYIRFITPQQKYSAAVSRTPDLLSLARNSGTDVMMDIKLNTTPLATLNIITDPITRDNLSLHGTGPLRMEYFNKGRFDLSGLYTIVGGTYNLTIKDIIRKNFEIQPDGYLRFNGNLDDGDINIKGVHRINSVSLSDLNVGASQSNSTVGVDCILNFTGKTSNPNVSFDIDFPQANADENILLKKFVLTEEDRNLQAVYLLSIGRFYTYNYDTFASSTGNQSQGATAMSSFLAGTLSGQVNNILQDALHIQNWNFGTNIATGRQGFNDMEVQGTLSGRMFNNRMLFNGNFGYRDQMTTYSNNFVGDFNLQWFLNKAGTISLKAYSETNDRYFTKSSLTTQGGGLLFQKDFTRLRDFFKKK